MINEVIKSLERGEPSFCGALHYLKEYRDRAKELEDMRIMYINAIAQLEDNPPLTWKQLKQMVGKPVWVEHKLYKQWAIIQRFGDGFDFVVFVGDELYAPEHKKCMGEEWQAYRKERE